MENKLTMGKFLFLAVILMGFVHPMHVSVCELDFDSGRNALEITQRIFLDDLELELTRERNSKLIVLTEISQEKRDELLEPYLKKHIKVSLNGKAREFKYLGHELEVDVIFLYFEITSVPSLAKVRVFNDLLLKTYDDQINIVHVSEGDNVRSMRLWNDQPEAEVSF